MDNSGDKLVRMMRTVGAEMRLAQERLNEDIAAHSVDGVPWHEAKRTPIRCFFGFHRLHTTNWTDEWEDIAGRCTCGKLRVGGYWLK